jgi:hypothetical protein
MSDRGEADLCTISHEENVFVGKKNQSPIQHLDGA